MMILRRNNRTKLIIVLSLMFSLFSLSALAQDKPMSAQALGDLITNLKEVVSKNSPDEKDAQLVGAKWDKRKDLTGKSKSVVINLLYQDVKAVIKDSGVQYQIYSIFSFYKQIPDKQADSEAETTDPATKPILVEQLTILTFPKHPYVGIDYLVDSLPGTKEIEAAKAEDRKNRIEGFDAALKVNKKLNAAQKAFVRANYDKLIKIADKITEDAMNKNFPTEDWIREGLIKSYSATFNRTELRELSNFFYGGEGHQVLKYIRQTRMAELITGNGGKLDYTDADKVEHDKFVATPIGKKFMTAFLDDAIAYEQNKENAIRYKNPNADGFAIYEPANLNKLFNKFVMENYKK